MKNVGIIGGGVIGLATAYYLSKQGHRVTVLDQGGYEQGCSYGNAGMIVPSHFMPLASPGMIAKGLRWMLNSKSPFYVKPRLDKALLRWGLEFYKHATAAHVDRAIPALKALGMHSRMLYAQWSKELPFNFGYDERGLLMMYQTTATEREELETAHIANAIGVEARVLNPDQVQALEPHVNVVCKGAVYFPGDAHLNPQLLMNGLIALLRERGVTFISHATVSRFHVRNQAIESIDTTKGIYAFDELILATGSWSGNVAAQLGIVLPMQAGKGYSFNVDNVAAKVRVPAILLEARVAVTPLGAQLRFGGTMEISGNNAVINMNRVRGIAEAVPRYYRNVPVTMPDVHNVWCGLRPCSPDGLPYIGRPSNISNLVVATGHAMMGLSLAPVTGLLVSEIIERHQPSVSIDAFKPDRYS